jgi:flagella basal body P-ring formation protein FlgA
VWQVFVAVQGESAAPAMVQARESGGQPLVRRGDRVVVEVGGEGWLVAVEGVAEADARDGRVMIKAGNKRLSGIIGSDGHIRIR